MEQRKLQVAITLFNQIQIDLLFFLLDSSHQDAPICSLHSSREFKISPTRPSKVYQFLKFEISGLVKDTEVVMR